MNACLMVHQCLLHQLEPSTEVRQLLHDNGLLDHEQTPWRVTGDFCEADPGYPGYYRLVPDDPQV